MPRTYYAYFDRHTRYFFYLNAEDGTRTWFYPTDGYVYEPTTLRPVYPPGSSLRWEDGDYGADKDEPQAISAPNVTSLNGPSTSAYSPEEVASPVAEATAETPVAEEPERSALATLEQGITAVISQFSGGKTYRDFASQTFKGKAVEQNLVCPRVTTGEPLLPTIKAKEEIRAARELSKQVLMYVHSPIDDISKCPCIGAVYQRLDGHRGLVDEMYCQAMRVLFKQENPSVLMKGLHVMLLLVTFFPPSAMLREPVATFLVGLQSKEGVQQAVAHAAVICLFRLEAACTRSDNCYRFHKRDKKEIDMICTHATDDRILYWGTPLWEIFLKEQTKYPGSVVPRPIVGLAKALFEKGAETTEGIFRLPGSGTKVEDIIWKAENGKDFITGFSIHDLASAFKNWYRDVPGGIVGSSEVKALMGAAKSEGEGKEFLMIANRLPPPNRFALMYLTGVLRRMQAASEKTKMTLDNLAMVFAPNVVSMDGDPMSVQSQTIAAKMFIMSLIAQWNVSAVYPDS
jgi:hypothetical protein